MSARSGEAGSDEGMRAVVVTGAMEEGLLTGTVTMSGTVSGARWVRLRVSKAVPCRRRVWGGRKAMAEGDGGAVVGG